MINLRYHIISITAVFLALGIGLTLGSTFLDRVTVDTLESQLENVELRVRETDAENRSLRERLDHLEGRDADLEAELPEQLFAGRLEALPVLVVATQGTDESLVAATVNALGNAGAQVSGTWWLTDRWVLDDDDEVDELSGLLGLTTKDVDRLRRNSAIRMADLLAGASQPAASAGQLQGPNEPPLVAQLVDAGFVDYEAISGASEARVLLPAAGAGYVVVSSTGTPDGPEAFAAALLDELSAEDVAPVVAAQGAADLPDGEDGPATEDQRRTTFVGPIRTGELTRARVTTVDDLDTAAGLAALVLALEDLGAGAVGHFGVAPGASRLLPAPGPQP